MRQQIRKLLQHYGYDIVKTGLPVHIYEGASEYPGLSFHPTPIGAYYLPKNNDKDLVVAHMKRGVWYDAAIIETARSFIRPGSCVLDVGANFGQMSIAFSKAAGPEGRVHCFEAQAFVYDVLQKNLRANACDNVTAHYAAVFDRDGETFFFPDPSESGVYGSNNIDPNAAAGKGAPVQSLTIDALHIDMPVHFMKVDIQGSDLFALRGAVKTIERHRMPIVFEYEEHLQAQFGSTFQDYVEFVAQIGYRFARTITRTNYLIVPK